MDIADYYRQLGLRSGANLSQVKAAYRRLARQFHPDVNPGNEQAKSKFIIITEAYKFLLGVAPRDLEESNPSASTQVNQVNSTPAKPATQSPSPTIKVTPKSPPVEYYHVPLSPTDQKLKHDSYVQLQHLLKYQKFPRAIALIEGLAQRIPDDLEVRQWQAIAYQRWGRHLISEYELDKARNYLKKALRTDPHNRALWAEVERDFRRLEQIY